MSSISISGLDSRVSALEGTGGVPSGCILMWSGSVATIPDGWFLCNGSNGTPDLRDRFIVGAGGAYNSGETGGAESVTLTQSQMPAHSHTGSTNSAGGHRHQVARSQNVSPSLSTNVNSGNSMATRAWDHGIDESYTLRAGSGEPNVSRTDYVSPHAHSLDINSTGGGQAHENRPPYYALCFIMKG